MAVAPPEAHHSRLRHVLVVTYGRSGSTLLQGALNTLPRSLVRGENQQFIFGLFEAYRSLEMASTGFGDGGPTHPWYGAEELSPAAFLADARPLVERQLLGRTPASDVDVLGFKEIRYVDLSPEDLAGYLGFMKLLWPDVLLVLHTRRLQDVARSGWWAEWDPDEVIAMLKDFEARLDVVAAGFPESCVVRTTYEALTRDPIAALAPVADRLTCALDGPQLMAVMAEPHSIQYPG